MLELEEVEVVGVMGVEGRNSLYSGSRGGFDSKASRQTDRSEIRAIP